jgi:hypothetical protein
MEPIVLSMTSLFDRYASVIVRLSNAQIDNLETEQALRLGSGRAGTRIISMSYAPFDHVEVDARLVIVGLTPGRQQARDALLTARRALNCGKSESEAAREAKVSASFSGSMRSSLVAMLDIVGLSRWLGIPSTAALWNDASNLAHFTSALRYPVFVDGENFSGQPDMLRHSFMTAWLENFTGRELATFPNAAFVPLGSKVEAALLSLAGKGLLKRESVLTGFPHPSGANAERIACFLGRKEPSACSAKTDGARLLTARAELERQVASLV